MSYPEFLVQPYNLFFLGAAAAALALYLLGRRGSRDTFVPVSALGALAVWGLTLTGAVHDLGLGSPAELFLPVLAGALFLAALSAWALTALRARFFPPVDTVRFNEPGLEGVEARVVSRRVDGEPGSGRAHWHDGEGVLHLVSCHTTGDRVRFGNKVQLVEFDAEAESYLVSAL